MAQNLSPEQTPLVADLSQPAADSRLAAVRVGVVTFPGTLDDRDAARAVEIAGGTAVPLWYADEDLQGVDAVILPGGFSYGDYLRAGAIARFAPLMDKIVDAASADGGMPVLGICLSLIHISEPTRRLRGSRMPSSA